MRKTIRGFLLLLIFTISAIYLTACHYPLERERLNGTYKLTMLTTKYDDGRFIDRLAEYGSERYLIIKKDGTGFYIEKDEGEYRCKELKFTFNENDNGKCSSVDYIDGKGNKNYLMVNLAEDTYLDRTYHALGSYKNYTRFSRVSEDETLAYVEEAIGKELSYIPYDKFAYEGTFVSDDFTVESGDYIYDFFYLYTETLTATRYTKTKEGVEEETILSVTEDDESYTIDGEKYYKRVNDEGDLYYLEKDNLIYWNFGIKSKAVIDQYEEQYQDFIKEI